MPARQTKHIHNNYHALQCNIQPHQTQKVRVMYVYCISNKVKNNNYVQKYILQILWVN